MFKTFVSLLSGHASYYTVRDSVAKTEIHFMCTVTGYITTKRD